MLSIVTATFVEDAAHIVLYPGENMPFTHVDWKAPQASGRRARGRTRKRRDLPRHAGDDRGQPDSAPDRRPDAGHLRPVPVRRGSLEAPEITIADSMACTMWERDPRCFRSG